MDKIVDTVIEAMRKSGLIIIEVSARHVHLCEKDLKTLFGEGYKLTPKRELSQPGQYLSEERLTIVGPKGKKERTAILGPVRPSTQVELSRTDCAEIGIIAPLRESGKVEGSCGITLESPAGKVDIKEGAIVAHNHVHLTPDDAKIFGVVDGQHVSVEAFSERPVIFKDVIVRVSKKYQSRMHIDFDEANAAMIHGFALGRIFK